MPSIFDKVRLRSTQLKTVADRHLGDAKALRSLKDKPNKHTNGAMYLGGFVIECLLKAKLLERYPWLESCGSPEGRPRQDQRIWFLCYRSHDLDELLGQLPGVVEDLKRREQRGSLRLIQGLKAVCGQWTIHARYSPRTATIDEADRFLGRIEELRKWLR